MPSEHPVTRAVRRGNEALYARDFEAYADSLAEGLRFEDRRAGLRETHGKQENIEQARVVAELSESVEMQEIETCGDRLGLHRLIFHAGDFEVGVLLVTKIDGEGRGVLGVLFDEDALDDARTELHRLATH